MNTKTNYPLFNQALNLVVIFMVMISQLGWFVSNASADTTEIKQVSVDLSGVGGNSGSGGPSFSADNRYVCFASEANNLVEGDTNEVTDAFFHDMQTGTTTRVSVASDGTQGNDYSGGCEFTSDGSYVAFSSNASNLVEGDSNGVSDIFFRDMQTGSTTRISVDSDGMNFNNGVGLGPISADGRYLYFESQTRYLNEGDQYMVNDIFVHDLQTGISTLVSVDSNGVEGNSDSTFPSISADGRYMAFISNASNLVDGDTNNATDVFVHDLQRGVTTRISVGSNGVEGNSWSDLPHFSANGRYVVFSSMADNLIDGDTNGVADIFLYDMKTGTNTRISVDSSGVEANSDSNFATISADGRYVAFDSKTSNLGAGDTNVYWNIYVRDMQTGITKLLSVNSSGLIGDSDSFNPLIAADGSYVAFESFASNLDLGDTNGTQDVFVVPNDLLTPLDNSPVISEGDSTSVTMDENGSPTAFELILNATDADGDTLSWSISSPASHGTASATGTGDAMEISYRPRTDYFGEDSFVVQVDDGNGGLDSITVNVTIVYAAGGTVSGTVYQSDGVTPLQGAEVCVRPSGDGVWRCSSSDTNGFYSIGSLTTRNYVARARLAGFFDEFYKNSPTRGTATVFSVIQPNETSGIDFTLDASASISGRITFEDGTPAAGSDVYCSGSVGTTNENGEYSFQAKPNVYGMCWSIAKFVTSDNVIFSSGNIAFFFEVGKEYTDVNFILLPTGSISGTVTAADGSSVANVGVSYQIAGSVGKGETCVGANGEYRFDGLVYGDYIVWAGNDQWCPDGTFQYQYWEGKDNLNEADVIPLSETSSNIIGINFTLVQQGVPVEVGDNVSVNPSPGLTIDFDQVVQAGVVTSTQTNFDPYNLSTNFQLLDTAYEITSSAQFTSAQVCVNYDDSDLTPLQESLLKLYHQENLTWVDVTNLNYPDTNANLICGTVTSFSPFAILYSTKPVLKTITAPLEPSQVNTTVNVAATFEDPDLNDIHIAVWDWGDGLTSDGIVNEGNQTVNGSHIYTIAGVYTIMVTVTDRAGASSELSFRYVIIYDPSAGFVSGDGWITSQAGAYTANPYLTGKATFGFESKYQKGAKVPTGNTEFKFKVGNLNFSSTAYDWLVVTGAKAQIKGVGIIKGKGRYYFMLTAIDGKINGGRGVDKFRIKIWDNTGVVYDNQQGAADDSSPVTTIQGGSIVVHKENVKEHSRMKK